VVDLLYFDIDELNEEKQALNQLTNETKFKTFKKL